MLLSQYREEFDSMNEETVKELAEASQTHYVGGKWITTADFAQTKYQILSVALPGSGDYNSFFSSGLQDCLV